MTDTGSTSSETPLVADDRNDRGDVEDKATSSSTSEPTAGPADDRSPQTGDFLLVVVGKSGAGKSSLCNLITGSKDLFPVSSSLSVCTVKTQEETVLRDGHTFCVMDTPADEEGDMVQLANILKKRLASFNNKVFFLFCVRCDARYAVEEHSVFQEWKTAWNNGHDFTNRLLVAFTHSDIFNDGAGQGENLLIGTVQKEQEREARRSAKGRRLQEMLDVTWPQLKELTSNAQGRFIFSIKETSEENDVQALIGYAENNRPACLASDDRKLQQRCNIKLCVLVFSLIFLAIVLLIVLLIFFVIRQDSLTNNTTTSPVTPAFFSNKTTTVFAVTANTSFSAGG